MKTKTKTCRACGKRKAVTQFYLVHAINTGGPWQTRCKACDNDHRLSRHRLQRGTARITVDVTRDKDGNLVMTKRPR